MNKIYITIICCFLSLFLCGQKIQVGVGLGLSNYQGDIASSKIWSANDLNAAVSLFIKKSISPQWKLKANILFTKLSGDDQKHTSDGEWRARRNYLFDTPSQELTVIGEWNFLDRKMTRRNFHPYLFAGVGVLFSKPTDKSANTNFVIPLGLGFSYDVREHLAFGIELSSHNPFSDQLDGFSDKAFSEGDDWFTIANVNIVYRLGKDKRYKSKAKY